MADWDKYLAGLFANNPQAQGILAGLSGNIPQGILGPVASSQGMMQQGMMQQPQQGGQSMLGPLNLAQAAGSVSPQFAQGNVLRDTSSLPSLDASMPMLAPPSHQGQNAAPETDSGSFWSRNNPDGTQDILGGLLTYDPTKDLGRGNRFGMMGATFADMGAQLGGHPEAARNVQAFTENQRKYEGRKALSDVFGSLGPLPTIPPALQAAPRLADNASNAQSYNEGNPGPTSGPITIPPSAGGYGNASQLPQLPQLPPRTGLPPQQVQQPQPQQQQPQAFDIRSLAPKLAAMAAAGVDVGPVLSILKEVQPDFSTDIQYTRDNRPYVLDHRGNVKFLDDAGVSRPVELAIGPNGLSYDKNSTVPGTDFSDRSKPWNTATGAPNLTVQSYDRAQEDRKQAPQWANAAETARHNHAMEEGDKGGGLSDPAKVNAAVRYNLTGTLPSFGMGKAARQDKLEVMNYAAQIAKGVSPEQLVANAATYKANVRALGQVTTQFNLIEQSSNAAKNSGQLALQAARAGGAGPTGIPALNRWIQAGRQNIAGDQNVMALNNHLGTFAEEYAKVMTASTGSAAATDSARGEAYKRLSSANNLGQLEHIMGEMDKEMGGRHYAARAQIGSLQKQLAGAAYSEPDGVKTKPPPMLPPPPPSMANLPRIKTAAGITRGVKWKVVP